MRLTIQAPIETTWTTTMAPKIGHDARCATRTPSSSWIDPTTANAMPSLVDELACDGTTARWIAPAATSNVASTTRGGELSSIRLATSTKRGPLRSPDGHARGSVPSPVTARRRGRGFLRHHGVVKRRGRQPHLGYLAIAG